MKLKIIFIDLFFKRILLFNHHGKDAIEVFFTVIVNFNFASLFRYRESLPWCRIVDAAYLPSAADKRKGMGCFFGAGFVSPLPTLLIRLAILQLGERKAPFHNFIQKEYSPFSGFTESNARPWPGVMVPCSKQFFLFHPRTTNAENSPRSYGFSPKFRWGFLGIMIFIHHAAKSHGFFHGP